MNELVLEVERARRKERRKSSLAKTHLVLAPSLGFQADHHTTVTPGYTGRYAHCPHDNGVV